MASGRFAIEHLGPATIPSPIEHGAEIRFTSESECIAHNPHLGAIDEAYSQGEKPEGFEVAGPRANIYFAPSHVRAAIVTCGGLSPGINAVIRGIVLQLWHRYGVRQIYGVRYGYGGLAADALPPLPLEPDAVLDIHSKGGTILGTSRGTPGAKEIVDSLERHRINMLFPIGGDGTMHGALAIWDEIKRRKLEIAVVGVPKTIDNDIPYVKRTFGFMTAVSIASQAIHTAHTEATAVPYGIGLVKLMGRHAGYIAATACLAAGHGNFCLVPEVPFAVEGPGGLLERLEQRITSRRHAVIIVAEGAGQYFFDHSNAKRDASGNLKLGDVGIYLKDRINAHFKDKPQNVTLKYIDPSYTIRSAAAGANDQFHCLRFAQNAVHAAMAGKSGLLIGYWHGNMTHVPMRALSGIKHQINPKGELWFSVLELTGQPAVMGRPESMQGA